MTMTDVQRADLKRLLESAKGVLTISRNAEHNVADRSALNRFVDQVEGMMAWLNRDEVEKELRQLEERRTVLMGLKLRIDSATGPALDQDASVDRFDAHECVLGEGAACTRCGHLPDNKIHKLDWSNE
jgi:hypothetical protein